MIVLTSFGRATLCGKRDIFAYISLAAGCIYLFMITVLLLQPLWDVG